MYPEGLSTGRKTYRSEFIIQMVTCLLLCIYFANLVVVVATSDGGRELGEVDCEVVLVWQRHVNRVHLGHPCQRLNLKKTTPLTRSPLFSI